MLLCLPSEWHFMARPIMTDVFHIPTHLNCPISNTSNSTECILEKCQILLINFYLSLARFLSHKHTCPLKKKKGNKVSVNLRNLMFILISNKFLNKRTDEVYYSTILDSFPTRSILKLSYDFYYFYNLLVYLFIYFANCSLHLRLNCRYKDTLRVMGPICSVS